jgi:hypothetical protein
MDDFAQVVDVAREDRDATRRCLSYDADVGVCRGDSEPNGQCAAIS